MYFLYVSVLIYPSTRSARWCAHTAATTATATPMSSLCRSVTPSSPSRQRIAHRDVATHAKSGKSASSASGGSNLKASGKASSSPLFLSVEPNGGDAWRLDDIAHRIRLGHIGIIPTDTRYAFVADLENKDAVQLLYDIKGTTRVATRCASSSHPCTAAARNSASPFALSKASHATRCNVRPPTSRDD